MKAIHKSGGSIAAALDRSTDYIKDSDKTNDGELFDSYECDPFTAQSEFLLSKRLYEQRTGRDQGKHDVIAYHVRMSFKPGEVTAEKALELGRELALRWRKNKHQFIIAAHTNTKNPHTHIIFNSVTLDCTHKFQDFKRSAIALRRLSDQICLEQGLPIIEKPKLSKGWNRAEYLGIEKVPTGRDNLRRLIDDNIIVGRSLEDFFAALKKAGVEIKHGKQFAFKIPGAKKFTRQDTLGDDYTMVAIMGRLSGKRVVTPKQKTVVPVVSEYKPNLLIDIQAKIQQGYGEEFEHWARIRNLKEAAKTLIYLKEVGLENYDDLTKAAAESVTRFNNLSKQIKSADGRMKANIRTAKIYRAIW